VFIKRRKQSIFAKILFDSKTISLIGFVLLIFVGHSLSKNLDQHYIINQEIKDLEQEIEATKNKNIGLDKMIGYLESEQFTEEQARVNFGLKKEGESVAVIKFDNEERIYNKIIPEELKPTPKEKANAGKWKKYFFR